MDSHEGSAQAHMPGANGLHFGAEQLQPSLNFFEEFVIENGSFVKCQLFGHRFIVPYTYD